MANKTKQRFIASRKKLQMNQSDYGKCFDMGLTTVTRIENGSYPLTSGYENILCAIEEIISLKINLDLIKSSLMNLGLKGFIVFLCHKGMIKFPKEIITYSVCHHYNKIKKVGL